MATPILKWNRILSPSGSIPRPRHGHRAVKIREFILIFGGGNAGIINELNCYNTISNQWSVPVVKGEIPVGCAGHGFAIIGNKVYCFGGMEEYGKYSNDLYELDTINWSWHKLSPQPPKTDSRAAPCPRLGHSFTVVHDKIFLFGGLANASGDPRHNFPIYLNDLYTLEIRSDHQQWDLPTTFGETPLPRESHSAVLNRSNLVIFGGMYRQRLGDLWLLDTETMMWTRPIIKGPSPLPRSLHTATVIGQKMYVFGGWVPLTSGEAQASSFENIWECTNSLACLNFKTMTWQELFLESPDENIPRSRAGHSAVAVNNALYVWSGRDGYRRSCNSQICCKDLWFLEVEVPSPPGNISLARASTNLLELRWNQIPSAKAYMLEIQKIKSSKPPLTSLNQLETAPMSKLVLMRPSYKTHQAKFSAQSAVMGGSTSILQRSNVFPPKGAVKIRHNTPLQVTPVTSTGNTDQLASSSNIDVTPSMSLNTSGVLQSKSTNSVIRVCDTGLPAITDDSAVEQGMQFIMATIGANKTPVKVLTKINSAGHTNVTTIAPSSMDTTNLIWTASGGDHSVAQPVKASTGMSIEKRPKINVIKKRTSGNGTAVPVLPSIINNSDNAAQLSSGGNITIQEMIPATSSVLNYANKTPVISENVVKWTPTFAGDKKIFMKNLSPVQMITNEFGKQIFVSTNKPGQPIRINQKIRIVTTGIATKTVGGGVVMTSAGNSSNLNVTTSHVKPISGIPVSTIKSGKLATLTNLPKNVQTIQKTNTSPDQIISIVSSTNTIRSTAPEIQNTQGVKVVKIPAMNRLVTEAASFKCPEIFKVPVLPQPSTRVQQMKKTQNEPTILQVDGAFDFPPSNDEIATSKAATISLNNGAIDKNGPKNVRSDKDCRGMKSKKPKINSLNLTQLKTHMVCKNKPLKRRFKFGLYGGSPPIVASTTEKSGELSLANIFEVQAAESSQTSNNNEFESTQVQQLSSTTEHSTINDGNLFDESDDDDQKRQEIIKDVRRQCDKLEENSPSSETEAANILICMGKGEKSPQTADSEDQESEEFVDVEGFLPIMRINSKDNYKKEYENSQLRQEHNTQKLNVNTTEHFGTLASAANFKATAPIQREDNSTPASTSNLTNLTNTANSNAISTITQGGTSGQKQKSASTLESQTTPRTDENWNIVGIFADLSQIVTNFIDPNEFNSSMINEITSDKLPDLTHYTRINLEAGTTYNFRLSAINSCGRSEWGKVSSFKTYVPGYPGGASCVKIAKSQDGAYLRWESPSIQHGSIIEYSVHLAVNLPHSGKKSHFKFALVYRGADNQCVVSNTALHDAFIDYSVKPAIIFRIVARNNQGYGPATQVRWLQDQIPVKSASSNQHNPQGNSNKADNNVFFEKNPNTRANSLNMDSNLAKRAKIISKSVSMGDI